MAARPTDSHILPDLLAPGLAVVFCGTAAGDRSAREGAYYAHPGNLFWRALHEARITPCRWAPTEFPRLLQIGVGLTDLAKSHSGNDADLPPGAFDADALCSKIERYRPSLLAFTSKAAARAALGRPIAGYGLQAERIGPTRTFVLPSPSGQARGHWDPEPWVTLGRLYRALARPDPAA